MGHRRVLVVTPVTLNLTAGQLENRQGCFNVYLNLLPVRLQSTLVLRILTFLCAENPNSRPYGLLSFLKIALAS